MGSIESKHDNNDTQDECLCSREQVVQNISSDDLADRMCCYLQESAYFATVQNATACLPARCHDGPMSHKKSKKDFDNATRASVRDEMAKPRMASSARIRELNLDTTRIAERPSTTMRGTVDKIIPSPCPSQPEKAQIAVDGTDHRYRNLRIENTLTDEHGGDVRLKKGAHVEVTVSSKDVNRHD